MAGRAVLRLAVDLDRGGIHPEADVFGQGTTRVESTALRNRVRRGHLALTRGFWTRLPSSRGRLKQHLFGIPRALPKATDLQAASGSAEGVGFEPTKDPKALNGFRDRPVQPLRHPSRAERRRLASGLSPRRYPWCCRLGP